MFLYVVIYLIIFVIWMTIELIIAPKGYEDESGFHYGFPKLNNRKRFFSGNDAVRKVKRNLRKKIGYQE